MNLSTDTLPKALELVGAILAHERKEAFHLVVCGGSALIAEGIVRRTTNDVDVLASRNFDQEISRVYPFPAVLAQAADKVATELQLKKGWLNGNASWLFPDLDRMLPSWFWQDVERRDFGAWLRVDFISRRGQILLKTYAFLNRLEERDGEDLTALSPDANELASALRHVIGSIEVLEHRNRLPEILNLLGHEELLSQFEG